MAAQITRPEEHPRLLLEKHNVKQLTMELKRSKFNVSEIHSDLDQAAREQVLLEFKSRRLPILVATDILSRASISTI